MRSVIKYYSRSFIGYQLQFSTDRFMDQKLFYLMVNVFQLSLAPSGLAITKQTATDSSWLSHEEKSQRLKCYVGEITLSLVKKIHFDWNIGGTD